MAFNRNKYANFTPEELIKVLHSIKYDKVATNKEARLTAIREIEAVINNEFVSRRANNEILVELIGSKIDQLNAKLGKKKYLEAHNLKGMLLDKIGEKASARAVFDQGRLFKSKKDNYISIAPGKTLIKDHPTPKKPGNSW